ncbi:hypothetical protein HPB50_029308 [Hyalomma asiaticum]|nr:hypothetical protein HPB50_029308 [Hyalomma asiaticum]
MVHVQESQESTSNSYTTEEKEEIDEKKEEEIEEGVEEKNNPGEVATTTVESEDKEAEEGLPQECLPAEFRQKSPPAHTELKGKLHALSIEPRPKQPLVEEVTMTEGSSDYEYPVRALWSSIGHQGGFEPLLVTCPTRRNDSLPRLVSLIYMGDDSSGWLSPRKVERVSKRTGTFALCVTVGEQTQPDPRTLAEFLAFYEAVGASHYIFYIKSAGTGLNYLAALHQKYAEAASTRDKLRVVLDTAQEDDEAVTSCVYDLATSPFEYALAVTPRDFVVPRHYATLKEFIQRYRLAGAMTILRYAFVGPRPVPGVSESSLISQLKVLRLAHADPPGMTSRALVRVADVVQMGARGGFSLLASSRAHVMDPRHVSVCRYVEDSEISPEEVLAYDDHMLGYGDFIRRSLPWRLHIERLGAS